MATSRKSAKVVAKKVAKKTGMRITNQDKFKLSQIARAAGLDIRDFSTSGEVSSFIIAHKHEGYYFLIGRIDEDKFELTVEGIYDVDAEISYSSYNNLFTRFEAWAKDLAGELSVPTGWENIDSENYLHTEFSELTEPFSKEEKEWVGTQISELKDRVKQLSLPDKQIQIINNKLDDIGEKVDKLNKFDWKSLFTGTIASLILALAVPPEAAGMLWEFVRVSFTKRLP